MDLIKLIKQGEFICLLLLYFGVHKERMEEKYIGIDTITECSIDLLYSDGKNYYTRHFSISELVDYIVYK